MDLTRVAEEAGSHGEEGGEEGREDWEYCQSTSLLGAPPLVFIRPWGLEQKGLAQTVLLKVDIFLARRLLWVSYPVHPVWEPRL